ncbi:MAG: M16 family metallopeptidase [Pyrinomonadaceae bacterium]
MTPIAFVSKSLAVCLLSLIFSNFCLAQGPQPRQEKLLNGLKVLMWNDPGSDKVNVKLRIHAGAAFDPQEKEGTMCLTADAFFPTNESREFFSDDLGGSLSIVCNYDYIEFDATSKAESYVPLLETLGSTISNPLIDRQTTDAVKSRLVTKLAGDEKNAAIVADLAVRKRLLASFPYGRSSIGTSNSIRNIDFADLKAAYDRLFGADNATLAISGNFSIDNGYRAIRRYFGSWLKSDKKVPSTFKIPDPPPAGTQIVESPEAGITEIRYAIRGVARNDKDFAAASVLAKVIEQRIRNKAPEAQRNNVWVKNYSNVLPGVIVIGFSRIQREIQAAVTVEKPKSEVSDFVVNALNERVTEAEFAVAKNAAIAELNSRDFVTRWLDADTYKFASVKTDQAAADSVTTADVQRVADQMRQQAIASVLLLTQKASD